MSSAPLNYLHSAKFGSRSSAAVGDPALRSAFRGAMDFLQAKRLSQFPDAIELQELRLKGEAIRRYSLSRLPELLEQLEARLEKNGIAVHLSLIHI